MSSLQSKFAVMIMALFVSTGVVFSQSNEDRAAADRAKSILTMFLEDRFDEFVATANETIQVQFSAEKAKAIKTQLDAQYGKLEGFTEVDRQKFDKIEAVTFELLFENNKIKLVVSVDSDSKLAGFHVTGVESRTGFAAPNYADQEKFHEVKVTIDSSGFELPATLSVPNKKGLYAGVVLVHGSGPHDEDETVLGNKPFRDLAHGLASQGVAVLRYEKRTRKYGGVLNADLITLEWETIDDAVAATKLLRDRSEVDSKRVFVLGHSLGGMAAPYIAKRDPKLAGIVILAGNARLLVDLIEDQIDYISKIDGQVTEDEASRIKQIKQAIAVIRTGKIDNPKENLLGAPLAYWSDLHNRDQVAVAKALDCPILIIQGGRDYQVTKKCFEVWKAGLGDKPNVTFKLYESLNHLMIAGEGPSTPAEYSIPGHVDKQVIDDVVAWLAAN